MFNGLYAEIRLLENGDWRLAAAAPGTLAKVENRIRPYQPKIYEHVIYQRTTISLLNLADTSPYTPIHPDAAAVILAPIQNDDESLGLLVIESDTPGVFLGSGMNQVEAMAASAAAVVLAHRARQKDHLHIQALEAQLATVDISRLSDSPKEIMELGLDLIVRGLNALRGAVLLPDEQGLMLKPVALRNWPGPFYNLELSVHDPGLQGVVVRRENLLLRNLSVEGEALPQFTDLLRRYKMHPTAALITPLATEDETLGLLLIARDDDLTFSSDDIRLSSRFARLMALALQRSQVLKPIP
jgi:GAF domain-containing protein